MTIDWFSPWPSEALLGVGIRVLEGLNLAPGPSLAPAGGAGACADVGAEGIVARVARVCVDIHKGVEAASERLYQEQQRRWFVSRTGLRVACCHGRPCNGSATLALVTSSALICRPP